MHEGSQVQITMKDPKEPSEVLGILSSPSGAGGPMLERMVSKGYRSINHVKASPLQPTEALVQLPNTNNPIGSIWPSPLNGK
jgi:hypothetical protein